VVLRLVRFSPTPLKQIQNRLKACKSYDLQAFIFYPLFKLSIKSQTIETKIGYPKKMKIRVTEFLVKSMTASSSKDEHLDKKN
jgi:hypothetical protein